MRDHLFGGLSRTIVMRRFFGVDILLLWTSFLVVGNTPICILVATVLILTVILSKHNKLFSVRSLFRVIRVLSQGYQIVHGAK
jgi:hypothetical protein